LTHTIIFNGLFFLMMRLRFTASAQPQPTERIGEN
jgi:hypothetical protein